MEINMYAKTLTILGALSLVGCATASSGKICNPINSFSTPAYYCYTPDAPPPPPPPPKEPISIVAKVEFVSGQAVILEVSKPVLNEVAIKLNNHPEVRRLRIEGHSDAVGNADYNRRLSQERAESVRAYLIEQGVDHNRLTAVGYGPDRPIADNETPEGRERNRRVEFTILEQDD